MLAITGIDRARTHFGYFRGRDETDLDALTHDLSDGLGLEWYEFAPPAIATLLARARELNPGPAPRCPALIDTYASQSSKPQSSNATDSEN
jgi:hypothetical protein